MEKNNNNNMGIVIKDVKAAAFLAANGFEPILRKEGSQVNFLIHGCDQSVFLHQKYLQNPLYLKRRLAWMTG